MSLEWPILFSISDFMWCHWNDLYLSISFTSLILLWCCEEMQCWYHALCNISTRFDNKNGCYWRARFINTRNCFELITSLKQIVTFTLSVTTRSFTNNIYKNNRCVGGYKTIWSAKYDILQMVRSSFLFPFFLKLIVAYRLCVIYVREDNDFNV